MQEQSNVRVPCIFGQMQPLEQARPRKINGGLKGQTLAYDPAHRHSLPV